MISTIFASEHFKAILTEVWSWATVVLIGGSIIGWCSFVGSLL